MRAPALLAVAASSLLAARPARAYEFEVDATTIAQGYQLRWFRFPDRDVLLNRRRFTQMLGLEIWDILAPRPDPGHPDRPPPRAPFQLYFTSSMRVDHDFGGFTQGDVTFPSGATFITRSATDVVPELAAGDLELDVLYAYLGGRGALGFLDFALGRQVQAYDLEWYSFDGLSLRARTPWYVALETHGGLVTRERIDWQIASPAHEPDGTSDAQCAEWDPGLGAWIAADRCRQRGQIMPTFGFGASTEGLQAVQARVAYRRSISAAPDGLYPPGARNWAVNAETIVASVRGNLFWGGVVPWAAGRWNLVLGRIDEATAGARVRWGDHAATAQAAYSVPSFDADSIFNVFSSSAYTDWRLAYDFWPRRGRLRAGANAYARRYESEDAPAFGLSGSTWSAGGGLSGRLRLAGGSVRADLFYEDGFGGLRAGGDASGRYRVLRNLAAEGRVTAIAFHDDLRSDLDGVTVGGQAGALWTLTEGIALHVLAEENTSPIDTSQFRLTLLLDLAFRPEI